MNKKLDKIGKITNIILIVVYCPLMLFGFLAGFMAGETILDLASPTILQKILFVRIPNILALLGPVVVIASVLFSVRLRNTGKSVPSFIIQFIPLIYYAIFFLLISFV